MSIYKHGINTKKKTMLFPKAGCNTFARYHFPPTYTLSVASRSSSLVAGVDGEEKPVNVSEDLS